MNVFELSLENGSPTDIIAFELNLQARPPSITGKIINVKKYLPKNNRIRTVQYWDVSLTDGCLNLYSCRLETGICQVHIFGKLKGKYLKFQINFDRYNLRDFDILNDRIKFILSKSKNILKTYYNNEKLNNIEHHLLAFLADS